MLERLRVGVFQMLRLVCGAGDLINNELPRPPSSEADFLYQGLGSLQGLGTSESGAGKPYQILFGAKEFIESQRFPSLAQYQFQKSSNAKL